MDQENIVLNKNYDEPYTMISLYLNKRFFGYKDSYNYYDIDVDKILLYKKMMVNILLDITNIVPLQLKIKNFYGEIHALKNNITVNFIQSDDKEHFVKIRETWNKIIEVIGTINAKDFVKNTIDDDADEFIMVDVHKNLSFVKGNYRDKIVIVLHSAIDNYLKTSLIQVKTHKCA